MLLKFMFSLAFMVSTFSILASAGVIAERKLSTDLESPIAGYAVAEPIFEGNLLGKHFRLNGTVKASFICGTF